MPRSPQPTGTETADTMSYGYKVELTEQGMDTLQTFNGETRAVPTGPDHVVATVYGRAETKEKALKLVEHVALALMED